MIIVIPLENMLDNKMHVYRWGDIMVEDHSGWNIREVIRCQTPPGATTLSPGYGQEFHRIRVLDLGAVPVLVRPDGVLLPGVDRGGRLVGGWRG